MSAGEAEEDGYYDEYALEDLEIAASDYIKPTLLGIFRAAWEGLPQEAEVRWPKCTEQSLTDRIRKKYLIIDKVQTRPCRGMAEGRSSLDILSLRTTGSWHSFPITGDSLLHDPLPCPYGP